MIRSINISQGYTSQTQKPKGRSININGYTNISYSKTGTDQILGSINKVLSPEIDVFASLPVEVYKIEHARMFLSEMKDCILAWDKEDLRGITLPKLQVTEFTGVTLVIEWIFNYFRLYFSFDQEEGDFFGEVMSDPENGKFHNDFRKMEVNEFASVAEAEVAYAIMMAEGGE